MDYETQHEALEIAHELQAYFSLVAPQIAEAVKAANEVIYALENGQDPDDLQVATLRKVEWKQLEIAMFESSLQVQRLACTLNPLLENLPSGIA